MTRAKKGKRNLHLWHWARTSPKSFDTEKSASNVSCGQVTNRPFSTSDKKSRPHKNKIDPMNPVKLIFTLTQQDWLFCAVAIKIQFNGKDNLQLCLKLCRHAFSSEPTESCANLIEQTPAFLLACRWDRHEMDVKTLAQTFNLPCNYGAISLQSCPDKQRDSSTPAFCAGRCIAPRFRQQETN